MKGKRSRPLLSKQVIALHHSNSCNKPLLRFPEAVQYPTNKFFFEISFITCCLTSGVSEASKHPSVKAQSPLQLPRASERRYFTNVNYETPLSNYVMSPQLQSLHSQTSTHTSSQGCSSHQAGASCHNTNVGSPASSPRKALLPQQYQFQTHHSHTLLLSPLLSPKMLRGSTNTELQKRCANMEKH